MAIQATAPRRAYKRRSSLLDRGDLSNSSRNISVNLNINVAYNCNNPTPPTTITINNSNNRNSNNMDDMDFDPPPRPIQRAPLPRRRSSVDNGDTLPQRQRRRSSMSMEMNHPEDIMENNENNNNSATAPQLRSSLQGGMRGRAIFRPPSSADDDDDEEEPLDANNNNSNHNSNNHANIGSSIHSNMSAPNNANANGSLARRTSMSDLEQAERRASIKQIMRDGRLSQLEKRRSIQFLMDGRRSTIDCGQTNPYLQAKAAAAAKLQRESHKRSSSFDGGESVATDANNTNNNNVGGGGEGEDTASITTAGTYSRRGSMASQQQQHHASDDMNNMNISNMRDVEMANNAENEDADMFTSISTFASNNPHMFAASNSSSANGGAVCPVVAPAPFAAANNNNNDDPWSSFNGGSTSASFNASSNSNGVNNDNGRFDHSSSGGGGESFGSGSHIEVPDHSPAAALAIAQASLQTHSDHLASKHPYKATTTMVPAVAAQDANIVRRTSVSVDFARRAIETAPPCTHYDRKCHIVSPCCGATFGCRICHDDCPVLPPSLEQQRMMGGGGEMMMDTDMNGGGGGGHRKFQRMLRTSSMPTSFNPSMGPPEHHNVDRFAIKEIICRECFTKQSSKTNFCVNCSVQFGEYHCAICNLWMSNEERPYHCPDCGFCRVGGGENFLHCQDCGMCIDKQLFADHNCKVGKYMSNCPVCQEDLFSSRDASHELPCGHAIHWHCFRELASHDSRCPMCKKTAETHERMKPTWDAMAMGIALQPVPPELCKVVTIKCNDCEVVQHNRSWHFLGVQCRRCESFNTVVERITMMGQEAHDFLLREDPPQSAREANAMAASANSNRSGGASGTQQGGIRARAPRQGRSRRATTDAAPPPFSRSDYTNE